MMTLTIKHKGVPSPINLSTVDQVLVSRLNARRYQPSYGPPEYTVDSTDFQQVLALLNEELPGLGDQVIFDPGSLVSASEQELSNAGKHRNNDELTTALGSLRRADDLLKHAHVLLLPNADEALRKKIKDLRTTVGTLMKDWGAEKDA